MDQRLRIGDFATATVVGHEARTADLVLLHLRNGDGAVMRVATPAPDSEIGKVAPLGRAVRLRRVDGHHRLTSDGNSAGLEVVPLPPALDQQPEERRSPDADERGADD